MDLIAYTKEIHQIRCGLKLANAPSPVIDAFDSLIVNTALQSTRQQIKDKCTSNIQTLLEYTSPTAELNKAILFLCNQIKTTSGYG